MGRRFRVRQSVESGGPAWPWAYQARRMGGSNYLLIDDAYAFIAPIFSGGVFLAMNGRNWAPRWWGRIDAHCLSPTLLTLQVIN